MNTQTSNYTFLVYVEVEHNPAENWGDRTPLKYAAQALYSASLPEASRLDGYADLSAEADIVDVDVL